MSNIKILTKLYYTGVLGINKIRHSKDPSEKRNAITMAILMGFSFVFLFGYLYNYCVVIADVYGVLVGYSVVIAMMMAGAGSMCFFNTILKGSSMLFRAQDDDLLLSMPIPHQQLILSKLLNLYLFNFAFAAFLMIPATLVYGLRASASPLFYLLSGLGLLAVPILPMIVASALSILIEVFAGNFRGKNLLTILLSLVFTFAIMAASFSAQSLNMEKVIAIIDLVMAQINQLYPLAGWYAQAVTKPDFVLFVLFQVISWSAFAIFAWIVAKYYSVINELLAPKGQKGDYQSRQLNRSSQLKTLYLKELKFFFSVPIYVMNTGIGALMMIGAAGMLLLQKDQVFTTLAMIPGGITRVQAMVPVAIAFFAALTCTTAVSLSLEGSMYPMLKSWPLDPMTLFYAKILVNLTLLIPAILISVPLVMLTIPLTWYYFFFALLIPVLASIAIAQAGIVINLQFPKFDWTSHVSVVKQSIATMIAIFGGMGLMFLVAQPVFQMPASQLSLAVLISATILLILNAVFYFLLKRWGRAVFYRIGL